MGQQWVEPRVFSKHFGSALTFFSGMERVKGIEPSFSAWEADVLPLNYTREIVADPGVYR